MENKVGSVCWSFPNDISVEHTENPGNHTYILDRVYPPGTSQVIQKI